MTSLDRLHQAMAPGEDGRPPALLSRTLKASLGKHGLSAAEQLLLTSHSLDAITNPEIKALFEKDFAIYQRIFEGGGSTMPAPEALAVAGINWAHLAELKETHSDHDLVVAPLTLPLEQLRDLVASVTNDQSMPNNPLKKYSQTKEDSDGLCVNKIIVDRWDDIMASTARRWRLPVAELELPWTAFLIPSSRKPEHLDTPFLTMRINGLSMSPLTSYIAYQMRRITDGQPPIEAGRNWIWTLGEFVKDDGDACAPITSWISSDGQVGVGWQRVTYLPGNTGIRPPIG